MLIRPAAVAGRFYPADARELEVEVGALLADNPSQGRVPKVLIAPHAGYVYSGPVAARAYNLLEGRGAALRRVVLLGPAHTIALAGVAIPTVDAFATPLGTVRLSTASLDELAALPWVRRDDLAHAGEHALEVHLPFLQVLLGELELVPLVVGFTSPVRVADALDRVWGGAETLIVISTDLSHYYPYAEAQRRDAATAARIRALESGLDGDDACGCHPLNGALTAARRRGLTIEELDLRNSGDTAGDKSSVVGYGAWALFEGCGDYDPH
jgi:MEMO1 family protein